MIEKDIDVDKLLIAPEVDGEWHRSLVKVTTGTLPIFGTTTIRIGTHFKILED